MGWMAFYIGGDEWGSWKAAMHSSLGSPGEEGTAQLCWRSLKQVEYIKGTRTLAGGKSWSTTRSNSSDQLTLHLHEENCSAHPFQAVAHNNTLLYRPVTTDLKMSDGEFTSRPQYLLAALETFPDLILRKQQSILALLPQGTARCAGWQTLPQSPLPQQHTNFPK